ncbi:hypothetical protein J010_04248 [Cryptococcus neoformans]|nr:hypothetical protein C355_04157 [Cryptococcus neoformans var. grubii Th84]OXH07474.1 hypothetical protein J010_04248 [Cryptococcus neoformans var. grubii]OXH28749.1 hypothetical protein J009_04271 [Cryptococcus neoformans var. grubii]OXH48813.1 hypothetical protein J004_04322 [Cryptococcus neoformans var. grubii]OXH49445.1 hypothetical protein J003_04245 [Cryptococcus neoformans var. grubii]
MDSLTIDRDSRTWNVPIVPSDSATGVTPPVAEFYSGSPGTPTAWMEQFKQMIRGLDKDLDRRRTSGGIYCANWKRYPVSSHLLYGILVTHIYHKRPWYRPYGFGELHIDVSCIITPHWANSRREDIKRTAVYMERKLRRMAEIEYAKKRVEFALTNRWPSREQEIRLMKEITTDLARELIGEHIGTRFLFLLGRTRRDYRNIVRQGEEPRLSPIWIGAIEEYIDVLLGPQRTRFEILESALKDVGEELGDTLLSLPRLHHR